MSAESNADDNGNPGQTLLNNSRLFGEYYDNQLLYPDDELNKWKRRLKIIRTRMANKCKTPTDRSPLRRPANNEPLHVVFKNIMNRDRYATLMDANDATTYIKWRANNVRAETVIGPSYAMDLSTKDSGARHKVTGGESSGSGGTTTTTTTTVRPTADNETAAADCAGCLDNKTDDSRMVNNEQPPPPSSSAETKTMTTTNDVKGASKNYAADSSSRKTNVVPPSKSARPRERGGGVRAVKTKKL